jgi:hypothetical protein
MSDNNTSTAHIAQNKRKDRIENYPDTDSDNEYGLSLYDLKKTDHHAKKLRNSDKATRNGSLARPKKVHQKPKGMKKYRMDTTIDEDYHP